MFATEVGAVAGTTINQFMNGTGDPIAQRELAALGNLEFVFEGDLRLNAQRQLNEFGNKNCPRRTMAISPLVLSKAVNQR